MHAHQLSRTTHTLDMGQVAEINDRLGETGAPRVRADDIELAPALAPPDGTVVRVWIQGSPEFPYIYADVAVGTSAVVHVPLHTPALTRLSHLLGLRHHWGL
jgi:hypothetical protein